MNTTAALQVTPAQLIARFNNAAWRLSSGLGASAPHIKTDVFQSKINEHLLLSGSIDKDEKVQAFGIQCRAVVQETENILFALGQTVLAADPEMTDEQLTGLLATLGLIGKNVDLARLSGKAVFRGIRYLSKTQGREIQLVVLRPEL